MTVPQPEGYWRAALKPRYSLVLALPLLLSYELLAFVLSGDAISGVRNGADVLLKSLFLALGGRWGVTVFGLLLVGGGAVRVLRDVRREGAPRAGVLAGMALESVAYALMFGAVAGALTSVLLRPLAAAGAGSFQQFELPTQLMISLGAGLYEELLFRVILVGGLAMASHKLFGWSKTAAGAFAVIVGALVFSGFHYVGPYGDPFEIGSFTFRTVAGVLFSGLYLVRGFGITAWTHALYDVFLAFTL